MSVTWEPAGRPCNTILKPQVRAKSGKLAFNLEDDRNNLTVMLGNADAMVAELEKELDGSY